MKTDSIFKIQGAQMNQLDDELNDLLEQADDLEQEIQQKAKDMALLRSQLELYDPNYKTEIEKVKMIPVEEYYKREKERSV